MGYAGSDLTPMAKRRHNAHPHPDEVKLISACPLCQASYDPLQARLLGEKEENRLLHIECANCGNALLALVLVSGSDVSSVGLITDLSADDVVRFRASDPVSADHVLAAHALLSDSATFFSRLL